MAERSSASTIASPLPGPLDTSSSTGRRLMMPSATPIPPKNTPVKLQMPESTTATRGLSEFV